MSLARLWQQQGKQNEAHQMLAEIYSWFTEGFDTKDLQEAKALLEELAEGSDGSSRGRRPSPDAAAEQRTAHVSRAQARSFS